MKRLGYFLIFLLLLCSCTIYEKPIFVKVDDVKVLSVASDTIRLKAAVFFKNPNNVGGKIATDQIKVIFNGVAVAQVSSKEFKVPAKKEFSIPLHVVIPTKKVFENNKKGILGGLLNSLLNQSIKVQFKGGLKYHVFGFSKVYEIDKTREIKL